MARHTKDRGITIGVNIMDMLISWECSIYQKFATFTVLLSFCFFCEVWLYLCNGCTAIFVALCACSDFICPFLRPYMGVIPNPKMAFIFSIS